MTAILPHIEDSLNYQGIITENPSTSDAIFSIGVSAGPASNTTLTTDTKSFDELVQMFSSAPVGSKDGPYYVRGPLQGSRSDTALLYAELLIIDGDKRYDPETGELFDSCVAPELVHEALKELGIQHVLHTSYSHDPTNGKNKFRAIIPCRMTDKNQLAAMVDWVLEQLKQRGVYIALVPEMTAWSQPWFMPRRMADNAFFKLFDYDGEGEENRLSTEFIEATTAVWLDSSKSFHKACASGESEPKAQHDQNSTIGQFLSKNDNAEYIIELLTHHGHILKTTRLVNNSLAYVFLPPNSTTGKPGVIAFQGKNDGRWFVASHNSSFTLPRPVIDAFGLYQYLDHGDDQNSAIAGLRAKLSAIDFSELLDDDSDEPEITDIDIDASGDDDEAKAVKSARRALIRGESPQRALARIRKQWPQIAMTDAQTIVGAAAEWLDKYRPGKVIEYKHVRKTITTLSLLNERYAMLEATGNPSCIINVEDGYPLSNQDYNNRLASELILVGVDKDGTPTFHEAAKHWREHCDKRRFNRIVFTPNTKNRSEYNLFNGYGISPSDAGEQGCVLLLQHIREVICSGNQNEYEAMLNLIAWQLQNIGRPSRIIVALFSEQQQVGKGALLEHVLLPLFGSAGFMTSDKEHFLGRFNDTLRGKAFLFLDEAVWAKDRANADRIKSLAQATTLSIETKGVPTISMPSGLNIWMATNHAEVASIEAHDVRYWVLRVSDHRGGDYEYFSALEEEGINGGKAAFLGLMLNRDVSGFHPQRDVPRDSKLLQEVKASSRGVRDASRWLEECCDTGYIVGGQGGFDSRWREWMTGDSFSGSELLEAYKYWGKQTPGASYENLTALNDFWKLLSDAGFIRNRNKTGRWWITPSIEACQQLLADRISGRK